MSITRQIGIGVLKTPSIGDVIILCSVFLTRINSPFLFHLCSFEPSK